MKTISLQFLSIGTLIQIRDELAREAATHQNDQLDTDYMNVQDTIEDRTENHIEY